MGALSSRVKRRPARAGAAHVAPRICGRAHNDVGACEELPDDPMSSQAAGVQVPAAPGNDAARSACTPWSSGGWNAGSE